MDSHPQIDEASVPREPWFLRSGWRLYATVFLILAVPASLLIAALAIPMRRQLEDEARRHNALLCDLLAAAVGGEMGGLKDHVTSVARRPLVARALLEGDQAEMERHLRSLVEGNARISRAFVTDARGIERFDFPHDPAVIGGDFSRRDWFAGVSARQEAYVSEIYQRSALDQPFVVSVAAPIGDPGGGTIGYLVGQYPLGDLRRRIAALAPSESIRLAVIDQHGHVAAGGDHESLAEESRNLLAGTGDAQQRETVIVMLKGQGHLVSVRGVASLGWTAMACRPLSAVHAPVHLLLRTTFLLLAGCLLVMAGLAARVVKTLRRYSLSWQRAEHGLREAKRAADEANRAKSQFLAVMSHELRTPLNGVIGMTDLLRDSDLGDRERRFAEACHDSAHALLDIINDILDLSKIEAERLELDCAEFPLYQCIDDSVSLMAHRAHAKGLELNYYVDPKVRQRVVGDHARVRQILVNLLGNAIKFTDRGHIILRAVPDRQDATHLTVRYSVTDTGVGIRADRLDRLFRTFSQVDRSSTRRHGGTGLGLAISKSLAEAMGGEIGVESTEGVGSTFWFTTCLRKAPGGAADLLIAPADLRSLRVLIVGDDGTCRSLLAQTFDSWEIHADVMSPGDEELERLRAIDRRNLPFDLVVFDLPVAGEEAAQRVRAAIEAEPPLPVPVFVLAPADADCASLSGGEAANRRCLRKPPSASELLNSLVDTFCGGAAAGDAARPAGSPQARLDDMPRRGARILVAEDNAISGLFVKEVLARAGFECDLVENGRAALDAVQQVDYDVVLMDCQMPEMDGLEAAAAIRRLESGGKLTRRVPIIALTANAVKGDREKCLDAGMDDYLSKPVEAQRLLETLDRWTGASGTAAGRAAAG